MEFFGVRVGDIRSSIMRKNQIRLLPYERQDIVMYSLTQKVTAVNLES